LSQQNARNQNSAPDEPADAAAFLARIDGILPLLKERAAEAERLRQLPDENIRAMTEAGIFRPASFVQSNPGSGADWRSIP
jgi:3-hydroxy-9,10-secoandrosta-1,3,5(10)-triene-9,17-dione monooxygenase